MSNPLIHDRRRIWSLWLEYAFWTAGIALLGFWGFARADAYFHQKADLQAFESALVSMQGLSVAFDETVEPDTWSAVGMVSESKPSVTKAISRDNEPADAELSLAEPEPNFTLWNQKRVEDYRASLGHDIDLPEGLLEIPSIDLKVAVLYGTDELTLNRGVGMIKGMSFPEEGGNVGIAGHRDGFFRGLKDVEPGEDIKLTTLDGVYTYQVNKIDIVSKEELDALELKDKEKLTLVTCYPFYFVGNAPKRYLVRATLMEFQEI